MTILVPLVPTVLFITLLVIPLAVIIFIFKRQTRHKKSPLTMELLRGPGQSLQEKVDQLTTDILIKGLLIPLVPITIYSIYTSQVALSTKPVGMTVVYVYLIGSAAFVLQLAKDVYRLIGDRNALRLGYECEVAVGQELGRLCPLGFQVYHDFPADKFNIDHIAIGPQGVFAIETKGRAKPRKAEKDNWKVRFDGTRLQFPGWAEEEPVQQAQRQAAWLAQWLAKATGQKCSTVPVLAIPGWWVERGGSGAVRVFNGKNPAFLAKGPVVLADTQSTAIAFQVEKQCRDVKTTAYNID